MIFLFQLTIKGPKVSFEKIKVSFLRNKVNIKIKTNEQVIHSHLENNLSKFKLKIFKIKTFNLECKTK